MTADDLLEQLCQNRVVVYLRHGELRSLFRAGAYTPGLRRLVDSYRGELVVALSQAPRPAWWPIDWREELRLERRLLLARLATCRDGAVKHRIAALAAERPDGEAAALAWGERLSALEADLRAAGRLPGYPWATGPAIVDAA
jgi:hypothetical protein